jgi:phage-related protein
LFCTAPALRDPDTNLANFHGYKREYRINFKDVIRFCRKDSAFECRQRGCFFDVGKVIILANGFHKKTQKTPKAEINKALTIKREYEQETQR